MSSNDDLSSPDIVEEGGTVRRQSSIRHCLGSPTINKKSSTQRSKNNPNAITFALRWTTNVSSLLSVFLFSGIVFGWAPLKLILIAEGQYSELCASGEPTPCVAQMNRFNLIFTLAQFFLSFASLPVGFFLDSSSKPLHYAVAAVLEIVGLVLFGLSDSQTNDWFVLSYTLIALGGCMTMLGAFPASFLLPEHQAGILAACSCFFDASSVVFLVFDRLYLLDSILFSKQNMFFFLAFLGVVVYATIFCCWIALEKRDWKNVSMEEEEKYLDKQAVRLSASIVDPKDLKMLENLEDDANGEAQLDTSNIELDPHLKRIKDLHMHDLPLKKQLVSFEFFLVLIFATVHMLRCNFTIETINELLASIGDDESKYATIFSIILPCGIVFVPVIEMTVNHLGVIKTLKLTNLLGILFGCLLLLPYPKLQVINFAIFACFRAYLYATLNTFIALTFGVNTMGRVIGSTFTTAAIFTLLQYPAAWLAEVYCENDFVLTNLIMLALCIIPVGLATSYSSFALKEHAGQEKYPLIANTERESTNYGSAENQG